MANKTNPTQKKEVSEKEAGFSACKFAGCKHSTVKYSFCNEHFDMFKFGLITKNGAWVPDYEKKQEQYTKFKKAA